MPIAILRRANLVASQEFTSQLRLQHGASFTAKESEFDYFPQDGDPIIDGKRQAGAPKK
jgi:hypothetical protein